MTLKLAFILSTILGFPWIIAIVILAIFKTGLDSSRTTVLLPAFIILECVIPFVYVLYAVRSKKVTSWDLPVKEERRIVMLIFLLDSLITLLLGLSLGNELLRNILIIFLAQCVASLMITYYWKVSLHVLINTVGVIFVNFLFHWQYPWLYILIPLVMWARYILKQHDIYQLLGGFGVGASISLGLLHLFNYI